MRIFSLTELAGNPIAEQLEIADSGGAGCHAGMQDEIPGSSLSWRDVDAMAERRAACPVGFADVMCLGCGCALFVPETERVSDILCPDCQRTGEALAAAADEDDDPRPTPPAAAMPHPALDPERVGDWGDDALTFGLAFADDRDPAMPFIDDAHRAMWMAAACDEVLRRIDAAKRAAA